VFASPTARAGLRPSDAIPLFIGRPSIGCERAAHPASLFLDRFTFVAGSADCAQVARIIRPALRLAQNMVNLCGRCRALPIFGSLLAKVAVTSEDHPASLCLDRFTFVAGSADCAQVARIIRPALRLAQNMVNLCGRCRALPIFESLLAKVAVTSEDHLA
jgi:hypothetical protein